MAYPIKYIENNLVFNHDGECFAYYELLPYNYSFLSPEQKYQVHDSFRQLIAQNRDGKIHALQISTESSIRAAQERSKQEVTGKLKDVACAKIDAQTEALISMIGENQVDYRFFIGFKLLVNEQEVTMKQFRREAKTAVSDFLHEVNHKLMGDFVSMSNEEIWRFQKMEKLLESKISLHHTPADLRFSYILHQIIPDLFLQWDSGNDTETLCILLLKLLHESNQCFHTFFWHSVVDTCTHTAHCTVSL